MIRRSVLCLAALCLTALGCNAGGTDLPEATAATISSTSAEAVVSSEASAPIAVSSEPSAPPIATSARSGAVLPGARRGVWIWEFGKNAPLPEKAATLAESWGVHRVFIKGSNGNKGPRWWNNASKDNLAAFTKRGIEVWLFGYFYAPDKPDADGKLWGSLEEQADALLKVALEPEVTGLVVDAEEEFKERPKEAEALCKLLRAKIGKRSLAYTSYGWLTPNAKFPFRAFDRHCGDAFLPQVYYAFGWPGDVVGSVERMEAEVRALGLKAPLWPIQSNERDPSVEKMAEFFERTGPDASIFYMHPDGSPQTTKLGKLRFE